jgi:GTPase SAR1 family protein
MEETSNRPAVKVVLIGNSGAGKTSLAQRFVYDKFNVYSESTIGASFFTKTISVNANSSEQQEKLPASKSSGKTACDEVTDSKRIKFHGKFTSCISNREGILNTLSEMYRNSTCAFTANSF